MLKIERIARAVDFPLLAKGANLLALAVDHANQRLHNAKKEAPITYDADFSIDTPFGRVRIAGTGDDEHHADGKHHLLTIDLGGNDRYLADVKNIKYSWFDDFGTQLSLGLGFGFGRRADMGDGHSWAGGLGLLVDGGGGDDCYQCGICGIGNLNSLAVCWDKGGDDTWIARSNSFGQPYMESENTIRDFPVNCGLFIDGGGTDRYLRLPEGANAWEVDARALPDFDPWDFIRDGTRKSWRDHIPMPGGTVPQPGSTGAAVDSGG